MSKDEMDFDEEQPEDDMPDDLSDDDMPDELFDEDVDDDTLLEEDVLDEDIDDDAEPASDDDEADDDDTEALDDLEAEELEMLTDDEVSETIVADEEKQLRDIRRAQISIEASAAGGATDGEFVCSQCFLVKKASQLASPRKKICLDCAD